MVNQKLSQSAQHTQEETNPLLSEKIGADLLLRGWNMALQVVNEAIEHNRKSGVRQPERFTAAFFDHMEPMEVKKKNNWLKACLNIKTNNPYTLDSLESANIISEEEKELFGKLPLPRREIISLHRIQAPNKVEYLSRTEKWFGLNKSAGIVTMAVPDLDFTRRIEVTREYVDKDPEKGGGQVLVKIVGDSNQWIQAEKIYLTPFSKTTVEQAFKNAIPTTDKTLRGMSFVLIREGAPHTIGLGPEDNNLESFVNKPELYDKAFRPAATSNVTNINIDPRQLEAFLKYQQEHKQDHQYQ